MKWLPKKLNITPPQFLVLLFLAFILLGTFLLKLPPRTASFNTLVIGSMEDPSIFIMMLLMFVGRVLPQHNYKKFAELSDFAKIKYAIYMTRLNLDIGK